MPSRWRVFDTSVGTKILIGVTGSALFLYLILHIAGNALIFLGPETFNQYSHTLISNPLVPIIEIGLLLIFLIHIYKTVRMVLANQKARPVRYARKKYAGPPSRKSIASSTMILSGLWLLLFVVIHVRTFKYGPEYETASGIREVSVRAGVAAEPADVLREAGDQRRAQRSAFGGSEESRRAGADAFDRPWPTADFFDVDAGVQVFRHHASPDRARALATEFPSAIALPTRCVQRAAVNHEPHRLCAAGRRSCCRPRLVQGLSRS